MTTTIVIIVAAVLVFVLGVAVGARNSGTIQTDLATAKADLANAKEIGRAHV